jgi:nicotinamide-nucleotide amidase
MNSAAGEVLASARARGWRIATAESCTGGLVSAALTDVAGSSDVFDRGFVVYSNAAKVSLLGVPADLITEHGAVSDPVARAMAAGAIKGSDADLAIAVTGVAGPGGTDAKPEGLVWFAVATSDGVYAHRRDFGALGRAAVRGASVETALQLLREAIGKSSLRST